MRSFSRGGSGYRPFTHRSEPANQPLLNLTTTPAGETPSYIEDPFSSTTSMGYPFPPSAASATTAYTPSSVTATTATTSTTIVAGSGRSVNESFMSGGKRAGLRKLATTIVHPRRTRSQRKMIKVEMRRKEEEDRIREIEEFLESGRGGPVR